MVARPRVRSFPQRTRKPANICWTASAHRGFDVVAIVVGMCLLLAGTDARRRKPRPRRCPPRSRLLTWCSENASYLSGMGGTAERPGECGHYSKVQDTC